jgi:hypothetical protein
MMVWIDWIVPVKQKTKRFNGINFDGSAGLDRYDGFDG